MAEKKKREELHPAKTYPCPVCGGQDFKWGKTLESHGFVQFLPEDKQLTGIFKRGGEKVFGRKCLSCGNLLLFTETPG